MINLSDVSEMVWRWEYKIRHLGRSGEKTASDFTSTKSSISKGAVKLVPKAAPAPDESTSGSSPTITTFYEGPGSYGTAYKWVDYPPRQPSKSALRAQDRVAIIVYKVKDESKPVISGRAILKYLKISIHNPALVTAIADVLRDQDIHVDKNAPAEFDSPFRDLYIAYPALMAKHRSTAEDDPVGPFLHLLIKLLEDVLTPTLSKFRLLKADRLVAFETAWMLFPKDTVVVTWVKNCELLCKVQSASTVLKDSKPVVELKCKAITFNGDAFVWDPFQMYIPGFRGNKLITDLDMYPIEFHDNPEGLLARNAARGRKVLDFQGLTHSFYNGLALFADGEGKVEKHNVDSRVLIDVAGYNRHHLTKGAREDSDPKSKSKVIAGTGTGRTDSEALSSREPLTEEEKARNKKVMLESPEDLAFISPLLEGYALKNKMWLSFYVEDIKPVVWNDKAFDHLVYDEQQKDLVLSFVESHGRRSSAKPQIKDVIDGKGEGLIVLLSGPPGTGKTLTAEAVADRTRRPLFYLHAEDLGINAALLGANVKKVLGMATEWNAVVLLDEADVFMARREPQDIARNELVSIFLRELEYFRGVIFLTTNLFSSIDTAFRSRVSLHLLFPTLTTEARRMVWAKFLGRLGPAPERKAIEAGGKEKDEEGGGNDMAGFCDEDVDELAAWQLNGREIKTAVKMVKTWCDYKGYEMTLSRIENGIKVTTPHASKIGRENDTSLYDD